MWLSRNPHPVMSDIEFLPILFHKTTIYKGPKIQKFSRKTGRIMSLKQVEIMSLISSEIFVPVIFGEALASKEEQRKKR